MTLMTRSRSVRWLGALIGAAALLTALPAPALAKDRHHDHRGGHGRGHVHDRGCGHDYGWRSDRHDHGRHHAYRASHFRPAPRHWHGGHGHHAPAYYCGHCRSHFASYDGLYGHVHHHHHVPTWRVHGLLAQVSFGWAFGL